MINASYDKEFVFHDGRRVKNIIELTEVIDTLSENDFHDFVNETKNDFASWVEYVLTDKEFADNMRSAKSKPSTHNVLHDKIRQIISAQTPIINTTTSHDKPVTYVQLRDLSSKIEIEDKHSDIKSTNTEVKDGHKNKWFAFSKKNIDKHSEMKHGEHEGHMEESRQHEKHEVHETKHDERREHEGHQMHENDEKHKKGEETFWIIVYSLLILFILALLVYKFILKY